MNGVPIIVSDEQSILMLPMNHSPIPMQNDLEELFFPLTLVKRRRLENSDL